MKTVSFSLEGGNRYYGEIDGQRFFIGSRVSYKESKGLMNVVGTTAQMYNRETYGQYGMWASFIYPTAKSEGALFHTLNTYDRARFTFTFLQYAAHVPNGDFVRFLRRLLELKQARDYFPDLVISENRICRTVGNRLTVLETDASTAGLMDYLNPSMSEVEDTEVIQSARFVHWAQNDPEHRNLQVDLGIQHFKERMANYAVSYSLDGKSDLLCAVIADIRHQGRGTSADILIALKDDKPFDALLKVGAEKYPERIKTLKAELGALQQKGVLGIYKYKLASKDFVPA